MGTSRDESDCSGLSRREILRRGALGGAGLALPGVLAACGGGGKAGVSTGGTTQAAGSPKRGGRLRVGIVGNGSSETLDPNIATGEIDIARTQTLYERLVDFKPDGTLYNRLADQFSHNRDGTQWKMRLRDGVHFHDGSPLTADDVVYSLRYALDPHNKAQGATDLAFLKQQDIRKLDASTVEVRTPVPIADLAITMSARALYIFKNGSTAKSLAAKPNGTGPFRFGNWTRGERSLFTAFRDYRDHGGPYVDELEFVSINDATSRYTALVGGQVDAIAQLDGKLADRVKQQSNLQLLNKASGAYSPQLMIVNAPPFDDNNVRQAFRYMVDREALVQNALGGYGKVGNDLASWLDPDYASGIDQRQHDPERAKSLLAKAGKSNLTVSLATSDAAPGMLDSSTLIAEQAKQAGVTVKLQKTPADQYYSTLYLKAPFECTNWGYKPLEQQITEALVTGAVYNETKWSNKAFDKLFAQARGTFDAGKRKELYAELQQTLWDQGGYIIWGFLNNVDAVSSQVQGVEPSAVRNLGYYNFNDTYLS